MTNQNNHVIIRPNYFDEPYNITRYGAAFFSQIINSANAKGLSTTDLHAESATKTNFEQAISSQDPLLVNLFGHGNYNLIAGQNSEVYLQGGVNSNILSGRVVYDLSCMAGRDLGRKAFEEGAIAFLGYDESFTLYIDDRVSIGQELNDEVARCFFESHNAAPISYINGSTINNSYYASQKEFNDWIKVWEDIDPFVVAELMWDRDHQILYSIEGSIIPTGGLFPTLLMFAPLLLIPVMKKRKFK